MEVSLCAEVRGPDVRGPEAVGAELELMENGDGVSVTRTPQASPLNSMPHLLYLAEDSSDDEWYSTPQGVRRWESRKNNSSIERSGGSPDAETTCYICQVTFARATSLSSHLKNAHEDSSLYCRSCSIYSNNLWELNKHIGNQHWTAKSSDTPPEGDVSSGVNGSKGCQTTPVDPGIPKEEPLNNIYVLNDHTYDIKIQTEHDHTYCAVSPGCHKVEPDQIALGGGVKQEEEEEEEWVDEPQNGTAPLPDWLAQDTGRGEDMKTERPGETEGAERTSAPPKNVDEEVEEEEEESDTNSSLGGDSDFRPDDASDTESASESSTGGRRYTRSSAKSNQCVHCGCGPFPNMDFHVKRCVSGPSLSSKPPQIRPAGVKPNQCARCKGGPFMNMDWHMMRCTGVREIQCPICSSVFFTEKALAEHKARVHKLSIPPRPTKNVQNDPPTVSTVPVPVPAPAQGVTTGASPSQKCVHCGNGPFFSMDHHVQNCVKRTLLRCSLCGGCFPSDSAIMEHFVTIHKATAVHPVGELPGVLLPVPNSNSPGPSKPGPASKTASVVFLTPVGVKGGQGLTTTQATAPTTTTMPFPRVGTFLQASFVQPNVKAPVVAPATATRLTPTLVPVTSVPARSGSTARTLTLHYSGPVPSPVSVSAPPTTTQPHVAVAPPPAPPPPPSPAPTPAPLKILYMFKNQSRELAVERRLEMSWRSKGVYRCRQCGAASRQPSLAVRHRYLHRGPRPHRCHCGRTFRRLLYLLRHCVRHAEATSYICVSCGESFAGAGLLARHAAGALRWPRLVEGRRRLRPLKRCQSEPFSCHCGRTFKRPSAYLWHQLLNRPIARL